MCAGILRLHSTVALMLFHLCLGAATSRADLLSLLLTPSNTSNDALTGVTWQVSLTPRESDGPLMYGLIGFKTLTINGLQVDLNYSAWMVLSLTQETISKQRTDETGRTFVGHYYSPTVLEGYRLNDLVGREIVASNQAMVALFELLIDISDTDILRDLPPGGVAEKTALDKAIAELGTEHKARFIAAFGIKESPDFFFVGHESSGDEHIKFALFGLSPTDLSPEISQSLFHPLFPEADQTVRLNQHEFSIRKYIQMKEYSFGSDSDYVAYYSTEEATVLLNVVPEPASWVSLLAMGGLVAGYGSFRLKRRAPADP